MLHQLGEDTGRIARSSGSMATQLGDVPRTFEAGELRLADTPLVLKLRISPRCTVGTLNGHDRIGNAVAVGVDRGGVNRAFLVVMSANVLNADRRTSGASLVTPLQISTADPPPLPEATMRSGIASALMRAAPSVIPPLNVLLNGRIVSTIVGVPDTSYTWIVDRMPGPLPTMISALPSGVVAFERRAVEERANIGHDHVRTAQERAGEDEELLVGRIGNRIGAAVPDCSC